MVEIDAATIAAHIATFPVPPPAERPAMGTIIGWSLQVVHGITFVRGTVIRVHEDRDRPPHATEIRQRLLARYGRGELGKGHEVFACGDHAATHFYRLGSPADEPYPHLAERSAEDSASVFLALFGDAA